MDDLIGRLNGMNVQLTSTSLFAPKEVKKNKSIVEDLLNCLSDENIPDFLDVLNKETPYELKSLDNYSLEYIIIDSSFSRTLNSQRDMWKIKRIDKVICPYLLSAFLLMKVKNLKNYQKVEIMSLYHGTATSNIESICKINFDWRLQGSSRGHKFGHGMSFARRSTYACHYPNLCFDNPRTMIWAEVMVSNISTGSELVQVPPEGSDTTAKPNLDVIVKYDDAQFYPKYVIYFSR